MPDGKSTVPPPARDSSAQEAASEHGSHAYPRDLAQAVHDRCTEALIGTGIHLRLPELPQLEQLLSVCYQASLLREEARPVTFRLAVTGPEAFPPGEGPPAGLHRLVFGDSRPLDQHEIRRLAPAAAFSRTLIGATIDRDRGLRIWGLVHSGAHWLESVRGGRETQQSIPPVLIVAVSGPGRMLVSVGTITIAELTNGTLISRGMDVFQAAWLEELLATVGGIAQDPSTEDSRPVALSATIDARFGAVLACHILRRVFATVRGAQHGGMLIIVPERVATDVLTDGRHIRVKYPFIDEEPRRRLRTLNAQILKALAAAHRGASEAPVVGWHQYQMSDASEVSEGDAALFEAAHLVADLTHVDGAVVMTTGLDLLGFGAEIAGDLPEADATYNDDLSYLRDLGLIARDRPVRVANPIYHEVVARFLSDPTAGLVMADPRSFVRNDGRLDFGKLLEEFDVVGEPHKAVCGTCHVVFERLFSQSPHKTLFATMGSCTVCHSNHAIVHPTREMLAGSSSVCSQCHEESSAGGHVGVKTRLGADHRPVADRDVIRDPHLSREHDATAEPRRARDADL